MEAIAVKDLVKIYDTGTKALDGLELCVNEGEVFSLLGSNGAGKSTLINILNTFECPTAGEISVFGIPIQNKKAIRERISCVSQNITLQEHLTMKENFLFQCRLYHIEKKEIEKRTERIIRDFQLQEYENDKRPVKYYSGGIKRRIDVAVGMITNPKILFLDEPTVGMDIISRRELQELILKIKREYGITVFMTTHYLEEADNLSDTICIIKDGKKVVQDTPKGLRKYTKSKIIKVRIEDNSRLEEALSYVRDIKGVANALIRENSIFIDCGRDTIPLDEICKRLSQHQIFILELNSDSATLDDIFIDLIEEAK